MKDRFVVILLLTMFALMGAECQAPWEDDDDEEKRLPDRALASSPLLRAYYDMRDFPRKMTDLKIPEGDDFEDDHLTVSFGMGGGETVTSVRTHLYLIPPKGTAMTDVELRCRCVAPNGTTSSWKVVDAADSATLNPQAEVTFDFEFDGLISDGTWKIQLKDPIEDDDGRAVFRNASLHINAGLAAGVGGANTETVTLDADEGRYSEVPELKGSRAPFDLGDFGVAKMLRNDFVFTGGSFFVTSIDLVISTNADDDIGVAGDSAVMVVSPSGNWMAFALPEDASEDLTLGSLKLQTFRFSLGTIGNGPLMNLNGEPSAGTWSLYIMDLKVDNRKWFVSTEGVNGGLAATEILSMTLNGVS